MYQPPHFREERLEVQHALIRACPLGTLVSVGPSGLTANHIPFLTDPERSRLGVLRAHVARANPVWREAADQEALVVFQGSESYITPSWYETKRETGKVVPTWNYAVVHAHGRLRVMDDEAGRSPTRPTLSSPHR
jgi:transcriptional regulator